MRFGLRLMTVGVLAFLTAFSMGHAQMQESSTSRANDSNEAVGVASATPAGDSIAANRFQMPTKALPIEYGAIVQGGVGLTEERNGFKFIMAGVHAGKVLYSHDQPGLLHGNFEYAIELLPYWQSFTPKFQRANCVAGPLPGRIACSPYFTVGGTFPGISLTPAIFRWNIATRGRIAPWVQAAGGVLWTNHKYPAFGSPVLNLTNDGPSADASVWNFTPQGGVGFHYFLSPSRSIDFGANAIHISSASLGDRNPGVNASVHLSIGYTFWR